MKELFGYAVVPVKAGLPEMRLTAGQEAAKQEVNKCYQEGRSACIWRLGESAKVEWFYLGAWVDRWPD